MNWNMKILICGKGGSGKSTISVLIAKKLNTMGYKVLLVDADESNFGLHRLAGMPLPQDMMSNLGGKQAFKNKMNQTFPSDNKPFSRKTEIHELPEICVSESNGIRLAVIGKIHHYGEGCACAIGMLSKQVLSSLAIEKNEIVIVDTEAGIEHFGRKVDAECDLILGVIDPTYESLMMSKKIQEMAEQAEVDLFFILNKVDARIEETMIGNFDKEKIIARIPQNDQIFMESFQGSALTADLPAIDPICQLIHKIKQDEK
ncbi:MAG: ATP-binding protein [Desulfobacterium sp.]|nr:ATP-binding protein [Desulfobacterium sp.]